MEAPGAPRAAARGCGVSPGLSHSSAQGDSASFSLPPCAALAGAVSPCGLGPTSDGIPQDRRGGGSTRHAAARRPYTWHRGIMRGVFTCPTSHIKIHTQRTPGEWSPATPRPRGARASVRAAQVAPRDAPGLGGRARGRVGGVRVDPGAPRGGGDRRARLTARRPVKPHWRQAWPRFG